MYLGTIASRATTLLAKNPSLFCRVLLAKLNTARRLPPLPAQKRIDDVVFEHDLCHHKSTAPMYYGSYGLLIIEAMKRFMKTGDVFIDVGANVGYLSAFAAGIVGKRGQVHCFEPVPAYFDRLQRLAELNPEHSITPNCKAAGEETGSCTIYVTREPGQNTMVLAYKSEPEVISTMTVPVLRLDSYLAERNIRRISLVKIDAEGYELPILRGLQGFFEGSNQRPAIICEIAPRAYPLLGRKISELSNYMHTYGYAAYDLIDGDTPVDLATVEHVEDVLFLAKAYR
ncbi:MAG TPA: FkbM family methyltransferase [Candidatus Acidoferrales bacterium]|nr:FkbM family methyltransferase [Candidatus Acidoferrales bacterium]